MSPAPPGLVYYPDNRPGIRRKRAGRGFSYIAPDDTRIDDAGERKRIEALAVPPAYEDVWISPRLNGHLQATGRDARSRKQYRYHPDWTDFRAQSKFDDLADFGHALPSIRRRIRRDLRDEPGSRDFAIAATLALIDRHSLRVGHPDYVEENKSHGVTTIRNRHLITDETGMTLSYTGKGGTKIEKSITVRRLQRILNRLHDLPGSELLSWTDDDGTPYAVRSDMVNDRLAEITGNDRLTAKAFRTWNGSAAALDAALRADKITIKLMAEAAAEELCNTPTIARNSYIHPAVIALSDDPEFDPDPREIRGLRQTEAHLLTLIQG